MTQSMHRATPSDWSDDRAVLAQALQTARALDGVDAAACDRLAERLNEGTFNLVVAGEFKRGKSSVINALLGADVLPVAVVPLTSVVTLVRHGDAPGATVAFVNGEERPITLAEVVAYATEKGNPGNAKGVDHVVVTYPSAWLRGGIRIVDTPGIGSVHQHNTDVTYRFLPQADAVLFVASVDQPVGRAELDFLAEIRRYAAKVFCLLNKADYLSEAELRESIDFTTRAVGEALGTSVPVIGFSARLARGGSTTDGARLPQGGLAELERALQRLLGEERRTVWLQSLARALARELQRAKLAVGVELKALTEPVEQIEASLALFERRKQDALQAMQDDDVLLSAEATRLQKQVVEPALAQFQAELSARMQAGIDSRFDALRTLPLKQLRAELESYAIAEVRAACDDWRAQQDARLANEFGRICTRFWSHAQQIADELLARAAELFAVRFATAQAAADWQAQADFHYKFWSEPTGLANLGAALVLLLPRFAGAAMVRERAKAFAADLVETQSGRLRHDFEERLKGSARSFRRELRVRMEATVAGIEGAIASGMALRQRGADVLQSRRRVLASTDESIERLLASLAGIEP
jgi:predicted GTPase